MEDGGWYWSAGEGMLQLGAKGREGSILTSFQHTKKRPVPLPKRKREKRKRKERKLPKKEGSQKTNKKEILGH